MMARVQLTSIRRRQSYNRARKGPRVMQIVLALGDRVWALRSMCPYRSYEIGHKQLDEYHIDHDESKA